MAVESRGDLASRHGSIGRIARAHSWSYRSDNPICTRTMRRRDAGVEADAREWADLAFGVAKTPSRESLFWPGFPGLLGVDFGMAIIYTGFRQ